MDIIEAVKSRMSIRAYKDKPIPKEVIEEILEISVRAPSALNTQPWEFAVITGDVLRKIMEENVKLLEGGSMPNPDVQPVFFEGEYKRRQVDLAKQLYGLLGITKEDKEKRAKWTQEGFRYFNAPSVIIIYSDKSLSEGGSMYDVGAITQTIALVALKYGLGTCIQSQGILFPEVIRKYTDIPDTKRLIICITIGYPDMDFPANKLVTNRVPAKDITKWYGM
ncbi:MAG: nitroreductase [Thermodesulfobacteriota bacterium]|nr:nitroreductase [Thermodesulfobacteriota bacterium]